jgi:hypothetical protein
LNRDFCGVKRKKTTIIRHPADLWSERSL